MFRRIGLFYRAEHMSIILEGPDGSGKSSLSSKFGFPVIHPGAPPKDPSLELDFMKEQDANSELNIVYDRVTCISQQVYRKRMFDLRYQVFLDRLKVKRGCVIVYCRPPKEILMDLSNHTVAAHDTPEMLKLVSDNLSLFIDSYDILMSKVPHIVYNYTSSNAEDIIQAVTHSQKLHYAKLNRK